MKIKFKDFPPLHKPADFELFDYSTDFKNDYLKNGQVSFVNLLMYF